MARGALLHTWLGHIEWLDDGEPEKGMLRRVAHNFAPVGLDTFEVEIQAFRSMLTFPQTRTVLSRRGYDLLAQLGCSDTCCADVQYRTWRCESFGNDLLPSVRTMPVVYGIIDRLVLCRRGDKVLAADLLDFKSDALSV